MELTDYLRMQKSWYEDDASKWTIDNRDPVVGSYDGHNNFQDYETHLFKDFDTTNLTAIEYGCGPGRNLVRFSQRFARVDGVDIAETNLDKARENLSHNNITGSNLYLCDGKSLPVEDASYDVVFSVICLQHICSYDIRFSIMQDIKRVLKPGGYFCFQMGYNGKRRDTPSSEYYDNMFDTNTTNGGYDVSIYNEDVLKDDLINKLQFTNYKSDIRDTGPGDSHGNWIWVQVQK
jgi:ubiquinone/menaquinone biosynthesis C-methylase UbiE